MCCQCHIVQFEEQGWTALPPFLLSGRGKGGGVDFSVEDNEMDMSKTKPFLFIPMTHDFNVAGPCINPRLPQIIYHLSPIPNPHSRICQKRGLRQCHEEEESGCFFEEGKFCRAWHFTGGPTERPSPPIREDFPHIPKLISHDPPLSTGGHVGLQLTTTKNDERRATQEHFDNKSSKLLFGPAAPCVIFSYGYPPPITTAKTFFFNFKTTERPWLSAGFYSGFRFAPDSACVRLR